LRDLIALGDRAVTILGNHDLHLLSVSAGIRKSKKGDTIDDILNAPDAADLLDWIRHRPIAHFDQGMLMVHAGVLPQWDVALTLELADEFQRALRAPNWKETLASLYGNEPNRWKPKLKGSDRLRLVCNALTRMRFCSADGVMDFSSSAGVDSAPPGFMPWFDVPSRGTADVTVVFGHWAALGLIIRDNVIGLDSGCVWGARADSGAVGERSGRAHGDAGGMLELPRGYRLNALQRGVTTNPPCRVPAPHASQAPSVRKSRQACGSTAGSSSVGPRRLDYPNTRPWGSP
jgi:bis(5'-nucleosyl)-tetraphosphatase (symmetrical)